MLWTICVPTVWDRREIRRELVDALTDQVRHDGHGDVELLVMEDNYTRVLGDKLQTMAQVAQGDFVSFVDDDDWVADYYVAAIRESLLRDDQADCASIRGKVVWPSADFVRDVSWSIANEYVDTDTVNYRYVQHLNPVRRDIIMQVEHEGGYGEDARWSVRAKESGLIQREVEVEPPVYYYLVRDNINGWPSRRDFTVHAPASAREMGWPS